MTTATPIDLPRLLLALAKTEYFRADRLEDGCVEDVLLVKAVHSIRVDPFDDREDENVDNNISRGAIEDAERLLEIHAEQLVCHAALSLGYGEPPGAGVFPIHNFARTHQLWRRVPGGLADREQGTTDWFFPVALFEELILWEGTSASICDGPSGLEDNYAPGIEGFIEAIVDVVTESKTLANPRDFQILKPWRLLLPSTVEQELARLDRFWKRPRTCEGP
jgi:hypothetical protein